MKTNKLGDYTYSRSSGNQAAPADRPGVMGQVLIVLVECGIGIGLADAAPGYLANAVLNAIMAAVEEANFFQANLPSTPEACMDWMCNCR